VVVVSAERRKFTGLRGLGELGREIENRRGPDPYPRPTRPPPGLEELRRRRDEIEKVAAHHDAGRLRVFGSVARGDAGEGSGLDALVEMDERRGLFDQAALQHELEDLLECPVHVTTTSGLRHAREHTREEIEREAVAL
jgi:predicted nucleotidyltransferase